MGRRGEVERATTSGGSARAVLARVWPGLLLVLVGVAGFALLLDAVRDQEDLWRLDDPLLAWMVAHRTPVATGVLTVVTTVSGPFVLPVLVAFGCVVWARRAGTWWEPGLLAGAMVLATLVSTVLKALIARPRPPDVSMVVAGVERSFSFPSGHTIGAATLVLVGGYLVWHRHHDGRVLAVWAAASVVVTGAVALSRLYLGYHFLTDVLAGLSLAVAVLGVVVAVSRVRDLVVARQAAPGAAVDSR
ncbi:phosphatase PAP2 family protein [Cellulosimicrobium cellulans]|uniref:phosphatase PAP2 family protein n=1 Tax=Cellulosimicrobium cellulans TaxID=1710 RepID=UPI0019641C74|nr:phosphatase PAP2 family protein [Cellulosimicrobium cellulans]MBN0040137.1 phosphatase PAP2 family protein [Cellulosimicrobium cellulans]